MSNTTRDKNERLQIFFSNEQEIKELSIFQRISMFPTHGTSL